MNSAASENRSASKVAELIAQARHGSRDAFERLMDFGREYLLLIANEEIGDDLRAKVGASDLVQDTHMEAWQGFDNFRGHSGAELLAWLREILFNNLRDLRLHYQTAKRQRTRELSLNDDAAAPVFAELLRAQDTPPGSRLRQLEELKLLQDEIEKLPEDQRQVVLWRHREHCSFEEIGTRLNRSEAAVRKLWFRAIRQIQQSLSPHGPDAP